MKPILDNQPINGEQTAASVLEKVKALPEQEKAAFVRLFHQWETVGNGSQPAGESLSMLWLSVMLEAERLSVA